MRQENGQWTAPEVAPFSGKYHDGNPSFSPDGKRLYFDSSRPLEKGGKAKDEDIWYIEKKENGWSEPINAGPLINSGGDEKFVSVTREGTLYFKILHDLYRVYRVKGKYTAVEPLTPFNTWAIEVGAFIDPDEGFLIFESNRPGGVGSFDLYIAFRDADDTWSKALNIGKPVNTAGYERFAGISPDGKYLFYSGSGSDIYWLDAAFIKTLRPK